MNFSNEHLTRQLDIIPLSVLGEKITVIGAGAVGGWTTLALAKMGFCNISVWDDDEVDTVNMNSQFYRFKDIGERKVFALQKLVQDFTGLKVEAHDRYYEGKSYFPGIVIAAVDSMSVRRTVWDAHKYKSPFTRAVIDPRMGAESALLYVMDPMNPSDATSYEKSLYGDSDALQEKCTEKATVYTAQMLSGLVCKSVKDLLTRPDYLRTAQWNIREDEFLGFKSKAAG